MQLIDCSDGKTTLFTFYYHEDVNHRGALTILYKINNTIITNPFEWAIKLPRRMVDHYEFWYDDDGKRVWRKTGVQTLEDRYIYSDVMKHPDSQIYTEKWNVYPLIATEVPVTHHHPKTT